MKRALAATVSTLAAVLLIGGAVVVARPDWLPSWARARLAGPPQGDADAGLACEEHGVPERFCTLCHPELKDELLLCEEHGGIPEEICTSCHPEVAAKYGIKTCEEHGLPEAFCSLCVGGPSASAAQPDDGWCAAHNKPEALCEECGNGAGPPAAAVAEGARPEACRQPLPLVRLASAELAREIGIQTAPVVEESHAHRLTANAETAYDANRYAEVSPRVAGFLREVRADLGRAVRQGDVLAVVDSAEVSAAKTQFLSAQAAVSLAQATYERTKSLAKSGSVASKNELEALTALNQAQAGAMDAEQKLRNLGFDDAELTRIVREKDTKNLLEVVAPIGGAVVARHAVQGEAVQATTQLFAVADTATMWLWIDVYERDIASVEPGQAVAFSISGSEAEGAGHAFVGEVTWVGTEVNPTTRTTRIRAELANAGGRLRANQFGQAVIRVGAEHRAVVVPRGAVQRNEGAEVVFLPEGGGVYRPQRVVTRPTDRDDVLEVAWGVKPGQRVVTNGSFLLKTEIMKGAIGAGCCE
jgi:cobalt-zinc-cadmium efflux system membrane fusion protein